jgi:uncharacterized protein (TIGR02391 family)
LDTKTEVNTVSEVVTKEENGQIGIASEHKRLIQLVYDRFVETGEWPKSRSVQIAFMPDDFWTIVEQIDHHLLRERGEKSQPDSRTSLSIEGISHCTDSENHMSLFVRSLQLCVDVYKTDPENPSLTAEHLRGSLSLNETETQIALELLFVGDRIWSSASRSPEQLVTELKFYPDILRYDGVTSISEYLEVVQKYRPQVAEKFSKRWENMELKSTFLRMFNTLHPKIADRCEELYRNEHYSESVEAGFKVVRDRLRQLTGYERGQDAFGKGKLHIAGASAAHVDRDFNEGVKFILMAIDRFRSEKSHTSNDQVNEPVRAYEYLSMSSLAMRFLERADALLEKGIQ